MRIMEGISNEALLASLPPIEEAPIVEQLAKHGLKKFREEGYALKTPVDERGVVDYRAFVELVSSQVSPDYKWKAPFFDSHHLHYYRDRYEPKYHNGSEIPRKFRGLPIHQIWTARGFHFFAHVATVPSDVPEMDVMEEDINTVDDAHELYMLADQAYDLMARKDRSVPWQNGLVIDTTLRRTISAKMYDERRKEFIGELEDRFSRGLSPDLTKLTTVKLEHITSVEDSLPRIRRAFGEIVLKNGNKKRRARAISLPIESAA
jgi:hypothetical protein